MIRLRVDEIAKAKGMSIGRLSRASGISLTTIRRIFDDPYYSATTTTLEKIANALGVTIQELLLEEASPDK